jgi:hypothetical protein
MKRILILSALILTGSLAFGSVQGLQRSILQKPKKDVEIVPPKTWMTRLAGYDEKKKEHIYQDPKPSIIKADAKAGIYLLKWTGFNGKNYQTTYQRPDCVDIVVNAATTKTASGYQYEYTVQNLKSSGCHLNGFTVQTASEDLLPKRPSIIDHIMAGEMSPHIFGEGKWVRFAPLPPRPKLQPGQTLKVKLSSTAPPGLVGCRVDGGAIGIKGVGDSIPEDLLALTDTFGYEAWPKGVTIGPIDALKKMSRSEKIAYLLKISSEFPAQGWGTYETVTQYQDLLRRGDLDGAKARLAGDFKAGRITSEVLALFGE